MRGKAYVPFLLAILFAAPAHSQKDAAGLKDTARFCFVEWQPYAWMGGPGEADGISVEILRLAAQRIGVTASFTEMPWKRCLAEVEYGNLDAAMDGAPRTDYAVGQQSYVTSHYVFWVRSGDALMGASDPARLDGRRTSLIHGWWYPPSLAVAAPHLDVVELDSEESQLRGLALGRQDAAYGEWLTLRAKAERMRLSVRPLLPAHTSVRFYPLFHRGRADLAARFDTALGAMLADGTVDAVYLRRLGVSFHDLARQAGAATPPSQ